MKNKLFKKLTITELLRIAGQIDKGLSKPDLTTDQIKVIRYIRCNINI